jgi:GTPase
MKIFEYLISLKIKKSELRKGMVLLSPAIPPVAYWEFEADLLILHHPTTIGAKYQAMGKIIF